MSDDQTNNAARRGEAAQVSPHVWAIPLTFFLTTPNGPVPRLVHAYLVRGERVSALVDCGTAGCLPDVLAGIEAAGAALGDVGQLIATHEHADHMGAALPLVQAYGWPVAAHTAARRWLEDAALQRSERPLPNFEALMAGSITVDLPMNEGDEIDLGGCALRSLYTPGHSRGSQSLVVEPDGVIISGDALISVVAAPFYDDPAAVRASLENLRREMADGKRMLSSHAPSPSLVTWQALGDTLTLIERMETAVHQARSEVGDGDEDALVRRALDLGGWPQAAVTPTTRITVRSHLGRP